MRGCLCLFWTEKIRYQILFFQSSIWESNSYKDYDKNQNGKRSILYENRSGTKFPFTQILNMKNAKTRFEELLALYLQNRCSREEYEELIQLANNPALEDRLKELNVHGIPNPMPPKRTLCQPAIEPGWHVF